MLRVVRILLSALLGLGVAGLSALLVALAVFTYLHPNLDGMGIAIIIAGTVGAVVGVISGVSVGVWVAKP
jgi:hypothetical protein